MGIKQHNGNTKADRLAELKIRSPSIQLIKFGAIGLNAINFSPLLIAADTGSQYGTNITINDGDRITGDTADPSGNLYGVMTPAGNTPGNINLGNDVTVNVNDASGYAKGIIIQGKNSSLTANRLTVDVVGQTSAIGINLIGDYTHADLGTGSTIKSNDDGIIIGHSSTLTATQFTIENSNGIGLTINDYGTSVDLGSGSKITTDGSTGVYIGGGLDWERRRYKGGGHNNDWGLGIEAGYAYFLSRTVTIEPAVYYKWRFDDSDNSRFGIKVGFGFYF